MICKCGINSINVREIKEALQKCAYYRSPTTPKFFQILSVLGEPYFLILGAVAGKETVHMYDSLEELLSDLDAKLL